MTKRYVLSPRAQDDLATLWDDTVRRWGMDQAEFYIRQLRHTIETIAVQPNIRRACPEVREGYHKYPSGAHFLFYRLTKDGIDIVRIPHARMDFEKHV